MWGVVSESSRRVLKDRYKVDSSKSLRLLEVAFVILVSILVVGFDLCFAFPSIVQPHQEQARLACELPTPRHKAGKKPTVEPLRKRSYVLTQGKASPHPSNPSRRKALQSPRRHNCRSILPR